ncbi:MAG: helix-hairpin-helix domain-containing protein [Smithella sp.]
MTISKSQIKGLIAVCVILAIIPFFNYYSLFVSYEIPVFADQINNLLAIEVVEKDQSQGIYFVGAETSAAKFLENTGIRKFSFPDFKLNDGMKITVGSSPGGNNIAVTEIGAVKRLALGMKFDLNKATKDDLLLVKGIGESTAGKILDLRGRLNRFRNIEQLMEIKGIKKRRLAEIRKYLYVEKHSR